jgi:isoquinoline 1-oxidoreductase beta subunit
LRRRTLLLAGTAGAGALLVGWVALPQRSRLGSPGLMAAGDGEVALNGWIKIGRDGEVVLAMPRSEMGQGVYTALPMLAAEELEVPLQSVRIERAGSDTIYGNVATLVAGLPLHPLDDASEDGFGRAKAARWVVGKVARELGVNATGGSTSVMDAWEVVRFAAATARATLVGAAALQWRLPVDELTVLNGVVSHASGKSARYGDLARFAAATPPGSVQLKAPKDWKLIGTSARRLDVPGKVDGSARFGVDVRPAGLKYAAIRLCPYLGGQPGRVDAGRALAMPGAERLVLLPASAGSSAGLAVIGRTSWHAMRAAAAVDVDWHRRPGAPLDTKAIEQSLEEAVRGGGGHVFHAKGNVTAAAQQAGRVVEAWYRAPYLAHATLEPMNCTVQVSNGKVVVWAPTQVPLMARDVAARVAGVGRDDVTVHVPLLGGGFGRRLEVDYVAHAVRVAMDARGAPVQLLWSREEDTTHDFYRPMQVARLRAAVAADGAIQGLEISSAGDAITPRWTERAMPALATPVELPDKTTAEGLFDLPYSIANQRMEHVATRSGVPVGFWRSVGHSHNAFFSEGFIDEIAAESGQDPVELRRRLLKGAPRYLAVLELAARRGGWTEPVSRGRARGIALHESFGTVVAQVVEVSLEGGVPRVHRVVCALDCGIVVNPGIVAQQMEGAVLFALTAALHGRIDIRDDQVLQRNFTDSPLVPAARAPIVETWVVPSGRPPAGVGEPGVPPLAPALASALFRLTGRRLRSLPLQLA